MPDETTKDLKQEEGKPTEEESTSEETPQTPEKEVVADDLKAKEETPVEDTAKELLEKEEVLADGTPRSKKIEITFDKFKDLEEKSEILEKVTPLLNKLGQNPDLVDQVFQNKETTLEERVKKMEEDRKEVERSQVKSALSDALTLWPDIKDRWSEMSDGVTRRYKQTGNYHEAIQREYFAINPDAALKEQRLVAQRAQNQRGVLQSSSSRTESPYKETTGKYVMTDGDQRIARELGLTEEQYQKQMEGMPGFAELGPNL